MINKTKTGSERLAYLKRLQDHNIQDYEVQKCQTLTELDKVTKDIRDSDKLFKLSKSTSWSNYQFYSDLEDYTGIPVTVKLDKTKADHILAKQKQDSYSVSYDGELVEQRYYESLPDVVDNIQGAKSFSEIIQKLTKDEQTSYSATRYILDEARFSQYWNQVEWNGFTLPAQGEKLSSCKKWLVQGCLNAFDHPDHKHFVHTTKKQCARSNCPLCFESWTNRIANRDTTRITEWMKISHQKPSHVVLSMPERLYNAPLKQIKKELKKIYKMAGITAGAQILHPFRFDNNKLVPYVSPHFHAIVFGWIKNAEEIYKKTGWVVHKISTLQNEVQVFLTSKYILTHPGIKARYHTVVYFGNISYSKLKLPPEPKEQQICPYCLQDLQILKIRQEFQGKPPPFEPGFTGLTDWGGFEYSDSYEIQYYNDDFSPVITESEKVQQQKLSYSITGKKTAISCEKLDVST